MRRIRKPDLYVLESGEGSPLRVADPEDMEIARACANRDWLDVKQGPSRAPMSAHREPSEMVYLGWYVVESDDDGYAENEYTVEWDPHDPAGILA